MRPSCDLNTYLPNDSDHHEPSMSHDIRLSIAHPVVYLTIPVLGPHVLHPCPFIRKVPIASLTIVMIRAIAVVLDEALLAGKIDVAVIAHPVAVRILRVLFVSSIVREPALAEIAVRHRILH